METRLESPQEYLRQEYAAQQALFVAQPALIQRFLETQARQLAQMLIQGASRLRFNLPDRIVVQAPAEGEGHTVAVPSAMREQTIGGLRDRLLGAPIIELLRKRLTELSQSPDRAVVVSAELLTYATAVHMINNLLPAGRSITYAAAEGEEIPSLPVGGELEPESAITAATDAIAEEGPDEEAGRGTLQVPYAPAARRFYLPQWVAFDDAGRLLVNSTSEAEAHLDSMQRFMSILHTAVRLAPYIVVDEEYQRKRYGMLGQLVNQGRALAYHKTREIIERIKTRAAAQSLNRGLRLSLPYFDDQLLKMAMRTVEVIPAGRIMFIPAFVVRASREEQAKVAQDTRLNASTRKHLLAELKMLEQAFIS